VSTDGIALAPGPLLPPLLGQLQPTGLGLGAQVAQLLVLVLQLLQRKSVNFQGYYYARLVGLKTCGPTSAVTADRPR